MNYRMMLVFPAVLMLVVGSAASAQQHVTAASSRSTVRADTVYDFSSGAMLPIYVEIEGGVVNLADHRATGNPYQNPLLYPNDRIIVPTQSSLTAPQQFSEPHK